MSANRSVFKNFIENHDILIIDKAPASRTRLMKVMVDLGSKVSQIHTTNSLLEALEIASEKNIGIVLSEFTITGGSGFELFRMIRGSNSSKKDLVLILVTSNMSQSAVARAAEEDVDAFIVKPYTSASIEENLISAINKKIDPPQYLRVIEESKEMIKNADYETAIMNLQYASKLHPKPALAQFYIAQAELLQLKSDLADDSYHKGLEFESIHYKCLVGLYELLLSENRAKAAYEIMRKIAKYFPSNPDRFSQVVRLAVRTHNYAHMDDYYKIFTEMEERTPEMTKYIGAGLYVSGKYFLQSGDHTRALKSFQSVAVSCADHPNILRGAIGAMVDAGLVSEAEKFLSRFPAGSDQDPDYLISDFLILSKSTQDKNAIVKKGLEIFNKGIRNYQCLESLVSAMRSLGHSEDKIQIIQKEIDQAV